jgi:hypothetical protein
VAAAWGSTVSIVLASWVLFRATTLQGAWSMVCAMAGMSGFVSKTIFVLAAGIRFADLTWTLSVDRHAAVAAMVVGLGLAITIALPSTMDVFRYRGYRHPPQVRRHRWQWRLTGSRARGVATALSLSIFGMWQRLEFLYFQFSGPLGRCCAVSARPILTDAAKPISRLSGARRQRLAGVSRAPGRGADAVRHGITPPGPRQRREQKALRGRLPLRLLDRPHGH